MGLATAFGFGEILIVVAVAAGLASVWRRRRSRPMPRSLHGAPDLRVVFLVGAPWALLLPVAVLLLRGRPVTAALGMLPDIFGRPSQQLDAQTAARYQDASDPRVRSYIWLTMQDWGGDLVMSYFLRFSQRGPTLFAEIKKFLLTPLAADLRQVDALGEPRLAEQLVKAVVVAPVAGLVKVGLAPLEAAGKLTEAVRDWFGPDAERRRLIRDNPLFNYGSDSSLRASFASGNYAHYFQRMDGDLYAKALDREILDCLVTFLDDHNVDTSDLRERQSTILNSGIMVQGGNVQAESLAVGEGAQATKAVAGFIKRQASKAYSAAKGAA